VRARASLDTIGAIGARERLSFAVVNFLANVTIAHVSAFARADVFARTGTATNGILVAWILCTVVNFHAILTVSSETAFAFARIRHRTHRSPLATRLGRARRGNARVALNNSFCVVGHSRAG
jgi:hypothetical protein